MGFTSQSAFIFVQTNMVKIKQNESKRIDELDMAKGFAILVVIMRHLNEISGLHAYNVYIASAFNWMTELFMIMFILLSGYVFKSKGNFFSDFKNKVKQLLIPLLFYTTIVTAVYLVRYVLIEKADFVWFLQKTGLNYLGLNNYSFFSPVSDGKNLLVYGVAPLWYLHTLFSSFVLFILVYRLVDKRPIYFKVISIVLLFTLAMLFSHFDVEHTLRDTFSSSVPFMFVFINVFGFAGVLMLGSLFKDLSIFDFSKYSKWISLAVSIISIAIICVISINYKEENYALQYGRWGQYGTWSILVTTLGGCFLCYFITYVSKFTKKIPGVLEIFTFLGQNTLTFLGLHMIIGESICYLGGFWHDVYNSGYPVNEFTWGRWALIVFGTFFILVSIIFIKKFLKYRKLFQTINEQK